MLNDSHDRGKVGTEKVWRKRVGGKRENARVGRSSQEQ